MDEPNGLDLLRILGLPGRVRKAAAIVTDLIRDLADRRGLKSEWEAIDPEIKDEIVHTWVMIVLRHLGGEKDLAVPEKRQDGQEEG